jgi:hypothetical protein
MAQMQVGCCGVKSSFYAKRAAGFAAVFKALTKVAYANDFRRAFLQQIHLFVDWWKRAHV